MTRRTPLAIQGGGPDQLPADALKILRPLLTSLRGHMPDDYSRLPPRGRRVVLQLSRGSEILARVYDRADMPDRVVEILGLTGATQGPLTMEFKPARTDAEGIPPDTLGVRMPHPKDPVTKALRADTVTLAISPDGSLVATRHLPFDGRLVVTDAKTSTVVYEEGDSTINNRWIYIFNAWFTPDGRFLLALNSFPAIYIYDTKTWKLVETLPGMPAGGVAYYPSSDWKHGVVVSRGGEADLWDAAAGRQLAALDLDGELQSVTFSPDGSLFAVVSVRQSQDQSSTFHLRVWDTNTGKFVRELPSLYYFQHDEIGVPMWWENGKYLLAEARESRFGGYVISIWNVESGKLRGEFSGCEYSDDPFDVALSGQRLFKWCRDGKLLTWDVARAVQQIQEFEGSVKP
jgi:WD40 repeat protein